MLALQPAQPSDHPGFVQVSKRPDNDYEDVPPPPDFEYVEPPPVIAPLYQPEPRVKPDNGRNQRAAAPVEPVQQQPDPVPGEVAGGNDDEVEIAPPTVETKTVTPPVEAESVSRHVRVEVARTDDPDKDKRKLQRIHGALISQPGKDRFSIVLIQGDRTVEFDFPNETTRYCPELLEKLSRIINPASVRILSLED